MAHRKFPWLTLLLALTMALSACTGGSTPAAQTPGIGPGTAPPASTEPAKPKVMTLGMWSSPDTFFHPILKNTYSANVISLIYPYLIVRNDKLQWQGALAENWTVSGDQTTFTVNLRKNAKWSDGKPITAHDVAFTYGLNAHKDVPSTRRGLLTTLQGVDEKGVNLKPDSLEIEGIKVVDDHKLVFTAKSPVDVDSFVEKVLSLIAIYPKHVAGKYQDLKNIGKADFAMKPQVTGGPYRFVQYVADSHIELEKNPDYYLGAPKVDKLFLKIVTASAFAAALEKGEIDASTGAGTGEVPITDWEMVSKLPHLNPVAYDAFGYQFLEANTSRMYLGSPAVRQGLAAAINRDLIIQRLLRGNGTVLNTPIVSISEYYRKDLEGSLAYGAETARKLLTEAGWDFGRELSLLVPTGNIVREQSSEIIQAGLQAAGVKVKIEKMDFNTMVSRWQAGNFDLLLVGWSASFDPDFSLLVSTGNAYNFRKYSNPEMDDLLRRGTLTPKLEERKQIYGKLQEMFVKELPFIPLYAPKALVAVNKRVQNFKIGAQGFAWNAHEWDVKQ